MTDSAYSKARSSRLMRRRYALISMMVMLLLCRIPGRRRYGQYQYARAWRIGYDRRCMAAALAPMSVIDQTWMAFTRPIRASCLKPVLATRTFEEMLEMASLGSKVSQVRSSSLPAIQVKLGVFSASRNKAKAL